jgi:hypothetical protein
VSAVAFVLTCRHSFSALFPVELGRLLATSAKVEPYRRINELLDWHRTCRRAPLAVSDRVAWLVEYREACVRIVVEVQGLPPRRTTSYAVASYVRAVLELAWGERSGRRGGWRRRGIRQLDVARPDHRGTSRCQSWMARRRSAAWGFMNGSALAKGAGFVLMQQSAARPGRASAAHREKSFTLSPGRRFSTSGIASLPR